MTMTAATPTTATTTATATATTVAQRTLTPAFLTHVTLQLNAVPAIRNSDLSLKQQYSILRVVSSPNSIVSHLYFLSGEENSLPFVGTEVSFYRWPNYLGYFGLYMVQSWASVLFVFL